MSESTHPVPAPADMPAEPTTLPERLAADLVTLAEIVQDHPHLAEVLHDSLQIVQVVMRGRHGIDHPDIATAVLEHGATELPQAWVEPKWATRAWRLPAGAVQLTCTRLAIPADVSDVVPATG